MKPLRLWNGRWIGSRGERQHIYVAAYSREDAVRVVTEVLGREPRGIRGEIKDYWFDGCWGRAMDGITPERGAWVCDEPNGRPVRLTASREGVTVGGGA